MRIVRDVNRRNVWLCDVIVAGVGVSGADAEENDGVYSRYFTNFTGDGTYTVKIEVDGDNDTQVATNSSSSGSGQQRADAQPRVHRRAVAHKSAPPTQCHNFLQTHLV